MKKKLKKQAFLGNTCFCVSIRYAQAHVSMKLPLVAEVRQGITSLHTKVSW